MPLELISSPFYETRKVLGVLRFCFGYPLCARNGEFNEFVFHTRAEYFKIITYTTIASINILYMVFLYCVENYSNELGSNIDAEGIIKFYNESLGGIGYSKLDLAAVSFTNYVNIVSNVFFFKSFQNNCAKLTNICNRISVVIKELECNCKEKGKLQRFVSFKYLARRSTKLLLCAEFLYLVAFVSYVYGSCYMYKHFNSYQKYFSESSVNIYLGTKYILVLFVLYPTTVASGEFVIYHLLSTIEEAFNRWNCLLDHKDEETVFSYSDMDSYEKSTEQVISR